MKIAYKPWFVLSYNIPASYVCTFSRPYCIWDIYESAESIWLVYGPSPGQCEVFHKSYYPHNTPALEANTQETLP